MRGGGSIGVQPEQGKPRLVRLRWGRYAVIVPLLAIAGIIAARPKMPESASSFATHGPLFVGLMV
jgi:K+-transporting ATPase ATPase A chain